MRVLAVLALTLLAACSTHPVTVNEAKEIPAVRVYQLPPAGTVQATFVRDGGLAGITVSKILYVNEMKVASPRPGEKLVLKLAPGEYLFGVDNRGDVTTIDQRLESVTKGGDTRLRRALN